MTFFISVLVPLLALASASAGTIHQQESNDVQLLNAWVDRASYDIDPARCEGKQPTTGTYVTLDCSGALPLEAPLAAPALALATFHEGRVHLRNGHGSTVEVRVAVKTAVLEAASFTGIGFYSSNNSFQGQHVVSKEKLQFESYGRLKNGEPVAVLRFVFWFPGIAGNSGTGWSMDSVVFKSFAEFRVGGETFQNWEDAKTNWRVYRAEMGSGSRQNTFIDRRGEVLGQ